MVDNRVVNPRHRSQWVLMAAAALTAVAVPAAQRAAYNPEWNQPAAPHKIIDNVYFVGTNELGSFLLTTPGGHMLIDPGFDILEHQGLEEQHA